MASRRRAGVAKISDDEFQIKSRVAINIGKTANISDNKWLPGLGFKLERV